MRLRSPFSINTPHQRSTLAAAFLATMGQLHAADLVVNVSGVTEPAGQIGCALFASPAGFPTDNSAARQIWLPADPKGITCSFQGLVAGTYAVSIGHDQNGNGKVDTNLLGMPTEAWGVSNNIRPTLRAPRFDEAAFTIADPASSATVTIRVSK